MVNGAQVVLAGKDFGKENFSSDVMNLGVFSPGKTLPPEGKSGKKENFT